LVDPALIERLCAIPVAEMSDTLAAAGLPGQVLASGFIRVGSDRPFAGPVICLGGETSAEPGLPIRDIDRVIRPGHIVVVGPGEACQAALVGGNMITSWRRLGAAGIVVDGFVRDISSFDGLPGLARATTPVNCRGLWRFVSTTKPITLPGQTAPVVIHPGDWLHGDRDGTVVLPADKVLSLTEDAEEVGRIEKRMRALIEAGEGRQSVYDKHDRFGHVRRAD
jgi:regulator of RNase E activity RraA